MKQRAKNLLIRWLFRLIDIPRAGKDEDKLVENWLATNWMSDGFRRYIQTRDIRFTHELAGGMGMAEKSRQEYTRIIGQRFELLRFASRCKQAWDRKTKEQNKQ